MKNDMGSNMATLSNPELQGQAQLNQVVNYSEFLTELAAQRHTTLRKYAGYLKHAKEITDPIDALIRDTLKHIEVIGLVPPNLGASND